MQRAADRADAEGAEQDAVESAARPATRSRATSGSSASIDDRALKPKTKPRSSTLPMLGDMAT